MVVQQPCTVTAVHACVRWLMACWTVSVSVQHWRHVITTSSVDRCSLVGSVVLVLALTHANMSQYGMSIVTYALYLYTLSRASTDSTLVNSAGFCVSVWPSVWTWSWNFPSSRFIVLWLLTNLKYSCSYFISPTVQLLNGAQMHVRMLSSSNYCHFSYYRMHLLTVMQ